MESAMIRTIIAVAIGMMATAVVQLSLRFNIQLAPTSSLTVLVALTPNTLTAELRLLLVAGGLSKTEQRRCRRVVRHPPVGVLQQLQVVAISPMHQEQHGPATICPQPAGCLVAHCLAVATPRTSGTGSAITSTMSARVIGMAVIAAEALAKALYVRGTCITVWTQMLRPGQC